MPVHAVVRTALSHTGQVTRTRFTLENGRIHLLYTKVDHKPVGHNVPWRAGPCRLHWCCRPTSVALLKGQKPLYGTRAAAGGRVDANLTYNDWLKQQSPTVQDEVLDKTKGDLYRAGKHAASIFTSDKGRTLTLKEMAARDARDFKPPPGEFTIYDPGFTRVAADVSTRARAAAVKIEDAIRNEANEFGAFMAPDGQVLLRCAGERDRVTYTEDELRGMKGTVVTHNHPSGLTFSVRNVRNAAFADLAEVHAVAPSTAT